MNGKAKLYGLIDRYISGREGIEQFCKQFEHTFNVERHDAKLSTVELAVFERLFSELAMHSPLSDEAASIPIDRSADQIGTTVNLRAEQLCAGYAVDYDWPWLMNRDVPLCTRFEFATALATAHGDEHWPG